jgi:RNA polymerase sigma-70 factor (ECF subfamily)
MKPPPPTGTGEVVWLEPYPDALLEDVTTPGPEARYEQTEAISLAFITALQVLPARQRAVLILREVLGYRAAEVADMLGSTVNSVNSALTRARAALRPASEADETAPAVDSAAERRLVADFVRAYEVGDVEALVELLTADVRLSMPPVPLEWQGRDVVGQFFAAVFGHPGRYDLVPTRANGQPAFGMYLRGPDGGIRHGAGLLVLTLAENRIGALVRFESGVFATFGLPQSLPG